MARQKQVNGKSGQTIKLRKSKRSLPALYQKQAGAPSSCKGISVIAVPVLLNLNGSCGILLSFKWSPHSFFFQKWTLTSMKERKSEGKSNGKLDSTRQKKLLDWQNSAFNGIQRQSASFGSSLSWKLLHVKATLMFMNLWLNLRLDVFIHKDNSQNTHFNLKSS